MSRRAEEQCLRDLEAFGKQAKSSKDSSDATWKFIVWLTFAGFFSLFIFGGW